MKKSMFLIFLIGFVVFLQLCFFSLSKSNQNDISKTKDEIMINKSDFSLNTEENTKKENFISNNSETIVKVSANPNDKHLSKTTRLYSIASESDTEERFHKNNSNENINSNNLPEIIEKNYNFLIEENTSLQIHKTAMEQLALVPENILNSFEKNEWKLYLKNENLSANYFNNLYTHVLGVTISEEKKIIIENNANSVEDSLIHEIGHYIDSANNFPSLSEEFRNIYDREINEFKSKIYTSSRVRNEMEFFAETYYYYITNSSKCTNEALQFVINYANNCV